MEPINVDGEVVADGDASYAASVINVRGRELAGR
jgi:hypothetical protein